MGPTSSGRRPNAGSHPIRTAHRLICVAIIAVVWGAITAPVPAAAVDWRGPLLADAVTSWWARPISVYQPAHRLTYMVGVSQEGDWVWGAYDHRSGVTTRKVLGSFRKDDHDTPAIIAPADKPPVVFYTGHNRLDVIWYRVSREVGDRSPGPERALQMPGPVTYVQAHFGRTRDTILLLTRCSDQWLVAVTEDYGETWAVRPLLQFDPGAYGYVISSQLADGTVRIAAAGHPDKTTMTTIRYCEIDPDGIVRGIESPIPANVYTGAGLPVIVAESMPAIYELPAGMRGRLFDVSAAPDPEVLFAEWLGDEEAEYQYLRREGDEWTSTGIVAAGRPIGYAYATRYLGGATFPNPTSGGEFYLSREASAEWRIEHWSLSDGSWIPELVVSSTQILARPSAPISASPQLPLLWLRLTRYDDYTHFTGSTEGWLPEGRPGAPAAGTAVAGDWDGDGTSEPGVFRDGVWTIQVDGSARSFRFGRKGDTPVVGDWDGDGTDGIAVRRGREWLLSESVAPASVSARFAYGRKGDTPVAGDWNGDGTDGIGVRRGSVWRLRNDARSGTAELSFEYGRSSDIPVIGDWTGDGSDGIGIRRGSEWRVRSTASPGPADSTFRFGRSSDDPVAADWGGLGMDSPGVRRRGTGIWYIIETEPGVPRAGYAAGSFLF